MDASDSSSDTRIASSPASSCSRRTTHRATERRLGEDERDRDGGPHEHRRADQHERGDGERPAGREDPVELTVGPLEHEAVAEGLEGCWREETEVSVGQRAGLQR